MPSAPEEDSLHGRFEETEAGADGETLASHIDWRRLVNLVQSGDPLGLEELYSVFAKGVRFQLCRQLGVEELDDRVHDTFLIVVQAIRRGELREPDRLMGFVRTIVRRQIAYYIEQAVQQRRDVLEVDEALPVVDDRSDPEASAIADQRITLMEGVLRSIPRRDREILTRFYLHGQSPEQICCEMQLSETQFRLLKSRAKARFGEIGRRKLVSRSVHRLAMSKAVG